MTAASQNRNESTLCRWEDRPPTGSTSGAASSHLVNELRDYFHHSEYDAECALEAFTSNLDICDDAVERLFRKVAEHRRVHHALQRILLMHAHVLAAGFEQRVYSAPLLSAFGQWVGVAMRSKTARSALRAEETETRVDPSYGTEFQVVTGNHESRRGIAGYLHELVVGGRNKRLVATIARETSALVRAALADYHAVRESASPRLGRLMEAA
ncbi:MAG: hypothetical protein NVS3B20_15830 [Polyangiales bacterium]